MKQLHHEIVLPDGPAPNRFMYFLHGVFGAGRNWGSVARRLVRDQPGLGAVLVDLREHGGSVGMQPPHTIAAAAEDVSRLVRASGQPATSVLGHSFGGKVALLFARGRPAGLERVWVVDSTPSARAEPAGSAWRMLRVIRELPSEFASRQALIDALERKGFADPVATWMATNLERAGDRFRWRFRLESLAELLTDFFRVDLWDVVEAPPPGCRVDFIKAADSSVIDSDDLSRLRRIAARTSQLGVHIVAGGHWLNADNPDALIRLIERSRRSPDRATRSGPDERAG
jgi:pimeloyl-ACP methyl ester carboxylesterase